MKTVFTTATFLFLAFYHFILAGNPIKPNVGMADPHIFIFNNKAYLYSTRDADSTAHQFIMPEWNIWSSDNLVDWKHERTILPTETYMGQSNNCWATDHAYRDGKYYFYFSNENVNTGVMVSDAPAGPYKDALGKPMIEENLSSGKEYDPTVFIDTDGKAYLIYGHFRDKDPALSYFLLELNKDMVSFSGNPHRIQIEGDVNVLEGNDKPNLHKRNGIYYLSAGAHYATSKSVLGPYKRIGSTGNGTYGLSSRAHGNFFEWNNQWFHTWCHFHLGKEVAFYRESYISYLHYKDNGEMVTDTAFLKHHFSTGVGQYDANWNKIEAEWYMAATGNEKRECPKGGFEIQKVQPKSSLYYPQVKNMEYMQQISFFVSSVQGGQILVYADNCSKKLLGMVKVPKSGGWAHYQRISCKLKNLKGVNAIYLVFDGKSKDTVHLDWFAFSR